MSQDVKAFVDSCQVCQAREAPREKPAGTMRSFIVFEPMQLVAIEALGPLPASLSGMRHVMVAVDCFSRHMDATATADVQGQTFALFLKCFVARYGVPVAIITNNAPTFCNQAAKEVLSHYAIEHRRSTPHHHEGNAIVERAIQTLQEKIALITHDPVASVNWEDELPAEVWSLNTTVHSATEYTPFKLLFGRSLRLCSTQVASEASLEANFMELRDRRHR